jgi:hypothetical protein
MLVADQRPAAWVCAEPHQCSQLNLPILTHDPAAVHIQASKQHFAYPPASCSTTIERGMHAFYSVPDGGANAAASKPNMQTEPHCHPLAACLTDPTHTAAKAGRQHQRSSSRYRSTRRVEFVKHFWKQSHSCSDAVKYPVTTQPVTPNL